MSLRSDIESNSYWSSLSPAAESRLNRAAIVFGYILKRFDSEVAQERLAAAYRPLRLELHTEKAKALSALKSGMNQRELKTLAKLYAGGDRAGVPYHPEMTKEERLLHTALKLNTRVLRKLRRRESAVARRLGLAERRRLRALHNLPLFATQLYAQSSILSLKDASYPSEPAR